MFKWDILIINAKLATMSDGANSYGMIENGAIAITNEEIQWVGSSSSLNKIPNELAKEVIDAQRNLVTPGLIDCHTHLVLPVIVQMNSNKDLMESVTKKLQNRAVESYRLSELHVKRPLMNCINSHYPDFKH